ncbi:MAG: energy transducer TonB [Blastocatellia bacterium]|nr:energy transducer TonB [Blastocatellia bacterium]
MKPIFCLLLVILGFSATVQADTWRLPTVEKYCSANKKYCLKVEPKKLESQLAFFQDKVDEKDNPGSVKGIPDNFCKGSFFAKGKRLWNVRLVNDVAPVSALVSNNGDYVITFDNWHGIGYGDDVVSIYSGQTGTLIKKLGLSDFLTESDIYNLPASTSSIHWHGTHEIDYETSKLILRVVKPGKDKQFFDVHVNLKDGTVVDKVEDRIPSLHFLLLSKIAEKTDPVFPVKENATPCSSRDGAVPISTAELNTRIISNEMPKYPPAARAVRATGESVFELVISPDGEVECVTPISGHLLLRTALVNAMKKWKFQKSENRYTGKIMIEGKSVLMLNGNVVEY